MNSTTEILCAKQFRKQNDSTKGIVVNIRSGIVTVLPASESYFNHLKIVGPSEFEAKSSGGINIYRMGTNLLVTFKDTSHPADIAVRDLSTDDIYLVALMPKAIPPRSYKIILTSEGGKNRLKPKGRNVERRVDTVKNFLPVFPLAKPQGYEGGYEDFLLDCLSKAALSRKIEGASLENPWKGLEIRYQFEPLKGLVLYSIMRWFISDYEIDLFSAKNKGKRPIRLQEPYLWQKGVLAVSFVHNFFEKKDVSLAPEESVSVFIIKSKKES